MIAYSVAPIEKLYDPCYERDLRAELLPGSGPELRSLYSAQLAAMADAHLQDDVALDMDIFNDIWERRDQLDVSLGMTAIAKIATDSQTGQQG